MIKNLIPAFILIFSAAFIATCGSKNKIKPEPATGKFNFSYLRYDSAALEYRLDSVHNRGLVMQPLVMQADDNNSAFQLISYAYDTLGDHNNSWMPDTLRTISDSLPLNFDRRVVIGNNEITREELLNVVRDDHGNRFSYDYVLFIPVVERVFNHLVYMLKPMKGDKRAGTKMQITSPMPPKRVWQ